MVVIFQFDFSLKSLKLHSSRMPFNLPLDQKLAASIKSRRLAEEQRKARIFNPKVRTMGIDVQSLDDQLRYSKLQKQVEEEKNRIYVESALRYDRLIGHLEKQKEEEIKKRNKELNEFRLNEQRREYRKEFDLYDPRSLKKDKPSRISDDDPRCTSSGIQKLQGEDLNHKERVKRQKEETRQALVEQMSERKRQLDKQTNELSDLSIKLKQLDMQSQRLAEQEKECKRKASEALAEYNKNLAKQQNELKIQKDIQEGLDKLEDVYNTFYGGLLNESNDGARSSLGPQRVVPDRWKGMSKSQLNEYYQMQQEQIIENKRNKEKEEQQNEEWRRMVMAQERQSLLMERERDRQTENLNQLNREENVQLAQEQKQRQKYLEKTMFSNAPSEEYYAQFNTTTR